MQVVKTEETNKRFTVVARLEDMEANWNNRALWATLLDELRFEDEAAKDRFHDAFFDRSCYRCVDRARGLKSDAVYAQFMLQL